VTYLLDTNACVALINGVPRRLRRRFDRAIAAGSVVAVSAITAFELWYGAAKSARRETNAKRLETFFAGPLDLWPVEDADARVAGEIRAALEAAGKPIGAYDILIAGQALRRGVTVVTANLTEFGRVPGLRSADWAK
jgi:tRNA(fMet)-specific endonuclease VapC